MNTSRSSTATRAGGFTLVELLVVIAIIAVLAGLLIPTIGAARTRASVARAKAEINNIVTAINSYKAAYGRYPVPKEAEVAAASNDGNYTFWNATMSTASTPVFLADNRGVMDILLAKNAGANTANVRNPRKISFLEVREAHEKDSTASGVGVDGVYRDPWGNPYIITFDLNYDEVVEDRLYREAGVSRMENDTSVPGYGGHIYNTARSFYQARQGVMVWSLGPDGGFSMNAETPDQPGARVEPNKDNITSWQQ